MGQRSRTLTQIFGFDGFKVDGHFEDAKGVRLDDYTPPLALRGKTLVLTVTRRWLPRCGGCGQACRAIHERASPRRWTDLPWAEHPVVIEYAPVRVRCTRCERSPVELIAWADGYQRQTRRFQQRMAVYAMSMPISHVAALYSIDWATVQRAQDAAIERWEQTRPAVELRQVGIDEKFLGRRAKSRTDKFVTIVSNLQTGEPVWIGHGRSEETLTRWLSSLDAQQKARIELFAVDMFEPIRRLAPAPPTATHIAQPI